MKKTILYIIDSLERGGAEIMLVSPLTEIHRNYKIIIVTLRPENVFTKQELVCEKIYCLQMNSRTELFHVAGKLKKIISENEVTLVHSFLYWSSIVARIACGKKVPCVFSLATIMTAGVYKLKWFSSYTLLLERLTYRKNHFVISPTKEVLLDFDESVGLKGKSEVLYNFVKEEFFENTIDYSNQKNRLRLVAVGNLKDVKNYQVLIDAFKFLKNFPQPILSKAIKIIGCAMFRICQWGRDKNQPAVFYYSSYLCNGFSYLSSMLQNLSRNKCVELTIDKRKVPIIPHYINLLIFFYIEANKSFAK